MKKMNKKGFTLIEMLAVIAVIAVLISIIIPTVASATGKAAAATNAANLRSLVAEATTKYLSGDTSVSGNLTLTITTTNDGKTNITVAVHETAPKSKECGKLAKDQTAVLLWDNTLKAFIASYNGYSLDVLAEVAEGKVTPANMTADRNPDGTPIQAP